MNLIISRKNNNLNNLDDKIIYDFVIIVMIIIISMLLLFDYLMTIIELKDEVKSIKKYIKSLTNIEDFNYKETRTKISLIMDNILYFQEEQDKNIKNIEKLQKEVKEKDNQIKNIENNFNKLFEELNKDIENQKHIEKNYNIAISKLNESIQNNKQLAIKIYYYWKTAHTVNPGLVSIYDATNDIIDGIYKHFYDTTFDIEKNIFSYEILEKTIPFLIKKKQKQLFDNTIFR